MSFNNFLNNKLIKSIYKFFLNLTYVVLTPIKSLNALLSNFVIFRFLKFFFFKENQLIINNIDKINFSINTNDWVNSRKIFTHRSFPQFDKFSLAMEILKEEGFDVDTLIDIGAHYGNIVVPAMIKYGFKEAHAIEPIQENFNILRANLIFNNLENKVTAHKIFLSNEKGEIKINTFQNNTAAATILSKLSKEKIDKYIKINNLKNQKIEKVTVDKLDNILKVDSKYFLWVYAQGGELNIIKGSTQLTKNTPPLVIAYSSILFSDKQIDYSNELIDTLIQVGYKKFRNLSQKNYNLENLNYENINKLDKKLNNNGSTNFLLIT